MPDWDVVILGGGSAGLAAALYLARAKRETIVLEKEAFGGYIMNVEMIENYPGFADGVAGSQLGMEMKNQAVKYGAQLRRGEVCTVERFGESMAVTCIDGKSYTSSAVIIAGGSIPKKLGVPGEEKLRGKGVINCAFCDGGDYVDRVVAICGGGDAGVTEALYLTKLASKVILIEALPNLTAMAVLQDRARTNAKLEIRCGTKVVSIVGDNQVEAIEFVDVENGQKGTLSVDGVLVHVGLDPNTDYLEGVVPLDDQRQIIVNEAMQTEIPGILAAGDIRSGSPRQVSTAVGDGATAGIAVQRFLQKLK